MQKISGRNEIFHLAITFISIINRRSGYLLRQAFSGQCFKPLCMQFTKNRKTIIHKKTAKSQHVKKIRLKLNLIASAEK